MHKDTDLLLVASRNLNRLIERDVRGRTLARVEGEVVRGANVFGGVRLLLQTER